MAENSLTIAGWFWKALLAPVSPPIASADAVAGLSPHVVALAVAVALPPLLPTTETPFEVPPAPPKALLEAVAPPVVVAVVAVAVALPPCPPAVRRRRRQHHHRRCWMHCLRPR
jgi:hypothetical protein